MGDGGDAVGQVVGEDHTYVSSLVAFVSILMECSDRLCC